MKKFTRILVIITALSMALLLCACAADKTENEDIAPENGQGTTETADTSETDVEIEEEPIPVIGTVADGVYENAFVGIGCKPDENWTFYTDAELLELNGSVTDKMTDETFRELLNEKNAIYDMFAYAEDGVVNMSVIVENAGALYGSVLDEKKYVELSMDGLETALVSGGCSDVQVDFKTVSIAGEEHQAVKVSAKYTEDDVSVDLYELLICKKVGGYYAVITITSFFEDITDSLAALYYAV